MRSWRRAVSVDLRSVTDDERAFVESLLPELADISNGDVRRRCSTIWAAAIRAGHWPDPRLAPTLPNVPISPENNLAAHTSRVLAGCRGVGLALQTSATPPDLDVLAEAAALHDVAKLVAYEPAGDGFALSSVGRSLPHAAVGSQWAIDAGSPEAVARAIYVHTPAVAAAPETIEAVILFAVDQVDADASRLSAGVPPSTKRAMLGGSPSR